MSTHLPDQYKINQSIPGWNGIQILNQLARYAAAVPENGVIYELGALFGRSTYVLGHNKKPSVKMTSIDIWSTISMQNHTMVNFHDGTCGPDEIQRLQANTKLNPDRIEGEEYYGLWKHYTRDIPNLTGIRNFTSLNNESFPQADFIFHDAGHDYKNVYADLTHWFPKLKENGVMIIDDYEPVNFAELMSAVDQFVKENDLVTEMVTGRNILLKRKL